MEKCIDSFTFFLIAVTFDEPKNPCQPSPCGPNALCQVNNDSPSCSCLAEFIGTPPNCRPECISNNDCTNTLACINQKCRDPCPGSCGANAECRVVNHTPMCVCTVGYTGDPFTQCIIKQGKIRLAISFYRFLTHLLSISLRHIYFLELAEPDVPRTPCVPSPCGTNAVCKEQNGAGSCICLPEYIGNPYEGCRPECTLNSDCAASLSCIRSKCQDPCPGTCGRNAQCQVVNHLPACTCIPGYTGDPFSYCNPIQPVIGKYFFHEDYNIGEPR
jgi:hypothetical protein